MAKGFVQIVHEETGQTAEVHPNSVRVWVDEGWKLVEKEAEKFEAEVEDLADKIEAKTGADPDAAKAIAQGQVKPDPKPVEIPASTPSGTTGTAGKPAENGQGA